MTTINEWKGMNPPLVAPTRQGPTKDLPARYRSGPILTDPVTGKPKSRVHLSLLNYDLVDDQGNTVNFVKEYVNRAKESRAKARRN